MKMVYKKNKMLYPLLLIVLVIWGIIMHRIIVYFTSYDGDEQIIDDSVTLPERINTRTSEQKDTLLFISLSRDPFLFPVEVKKVEIDTPRKQQHFVNPEPEFNYSINGIIINNEKQKMVIIEDLNDNIILHLREGEAYKTIKIKTIEVNQLTLIENGELKKLKMH